MRKVKCDEARPACQRCVVSGRDCEGYGVWGGGNTHSVLSLIRSTHSPEVINLGGTPVNVTTEDRRLLDWFRFRTIIKFQSTFGSPFWEALAVRAGFQEPAIFHAILALTSIQERIVLGRQNLASGSRPETVENVSLGHYSKAIEQLLKPRFAVPDKSAVRVALITCMIFTVMEFGRGHYEAGITHLRSGMKLLDHLRKDGRQSIAWPGEFTPTPRDGVDDAWLIESFKRTNFSALLLGQGAWEPQKIAVILGRPLPVSFSSLLDARNSLDCIITDIHQIAQHARTGEVFTDLNEATGHTLRKAQEHLKLSIEAWWQACANACEVIQFQVYGLNSRLGLRVLLLFHSMGCIMADTCLAPDDEMAYDAHLQVFFDMILAGQHVLDELRIIHAAENPVYRSARELYYLITDFGWLCPLNYVALHCRSLRLRLHAVKYMYAVPSREIMWDHQVIANVASEVIRLEHSTEELREADSFGFQDVPLLGDIPKPTLPRHKRLSDVRLIFSDSPVRKVTMTAKRLDEEGQSGDITREFDLGYGKDWFCRENMSLHAHHHDIDD